MDKKTNVKKILLFILIFCLLFQIVSMIYIPKWGSNDETNERLQMPSYYAQEKNSIDVLLLGSCNIYTSFSPLLAYDKYNFTSFVMGSPDQSMTISYHYLIEALKTQDIKLVVLESLFLTLPPNEKREYFNRAALDYMPLSLNKLGLIMDIVPAEVQTMREYDKNSPNELVTYLGYLFPLLRYHSRDDISIDDVTYYFKDSEERFGYFRGGVPAFSRTQLVNMDSKYANNGEEILEEADIMFKKIQDLCKEKNIDLLLVKSPNIYRWNEASSKAVSDYAKKMNVDYLDFGSDTFEFELNDYEKSTGRLNIFGMKKFTDYLSLYIEDNYSFEKNNLSDNAKKSWDESVQKLYDLATERGYTLKPGEIHRVYNETKGIAISWNSYDDADKYVVYRKREGNVNYYKVGETTKTKYVDETINPNYRYYYFVETIKNNEIIYKSKERRMMFVGTPSNFSASEKDGKLELSWDLLGDDYEYVVYLRGPMSYYYIIADTTKHNKMKLSIPKSARYYKIRAFKKVDDVEYYGYPLEILYE